MAKNNALKISDQTIYPGETVSLALPLPQMYSCAPLFMPIKVIHGKQQGPCLLVTAAMHGNELNGTEIVNRLFNSKSIKKLSGTLILVPVLNVYGLINRSRYLPSGADLNSSFPGSATGTMASRMAHVFIEEIFAHADYCIDLQTGFINCSNLPQLYVNEEDEKAKALARAFNAPVVSDIPTDEGMLSTYARRQSIPFMMYEAGEAMRFDDHAIKVGFKGIKNVMKQLQMLPTHSVKKPELESFYAEKNIWVRASSSGISHTNCQLGQHIKKDELLCTINDPFGAADPVSVHCPEEGVIVGKNNLPLVHEGEGLFQLAIFKKMAHAATQLEGWEEKSVEQFGRVEKE